MKAEHVWPLNIGVTEGTPKTHMAEPLMHIMDIRGQFCNVSKYLLVNFVTQMLRPEVLAYQFLFYYSQLARFNKFKFIFHIELRKLVLSFGIRILLTFTRISESY
jgi:hypothetical protein